MADGGAPSGSPPPGGVGSVAEETARLLDALLGGVGPEAPREAPREAPPEAPPGAPHDATHHGPHHGPHDPEAAADPAGVCHLCPVCQLLRVARTVRPETVDRLADLAALLTRSLRDVAATRHAEDQTAGRRPGPDVEDIPLDDLPDDLPDDLTEDQPDDLPEEPSR